MAQISVGGVEVVRRRQDAVFKGPADRLVAHVPGFEDRLAVRVLAVALGQGARVAAGAAGHPVEGVHEPCDGLGVVDAVIVLPDRGDQAVVEEIGDRGLIVDAVVGAGVQILELHGLILPLAAVGGAEDVGVIVRVQDPGGEGEPIRDLLPQPPEVLSGQLAAVRGDHGAGGGVIADVLSQKALIGEDGDVLGIRQGIHARQQTGVVLQTEEVQHRGEDVRGAAVIVHLDGLPQTRGVANEGVVVPLEDRVDGDARQIVVLRLGEAVGVVVVGEHDAGVVQLPRLLQGVQQVLHGVLQLQIAGHEGLDGLGGVGQILHGGAVLGAHVVVPAVLIVAAVGHVVDVEGILAVDVVRQGRLDHVQIGGGRLHLHVQAVVRSLESIAHVWMGDVAVVEVAHIVVVAQGGVALISQNVAEAEGQIVCSRDIEAGAGFRSRQIRQQAHAEGVLPVGGHRLEGAVEVLEHETVAVGHLVEGRSQLRVHEPGGIALGTDVDQVIALQRSGVFVLFGGLPAGEEGVQIPQLLVLGLVIESGEVQVLQDVVFSRVVAALPQLAAQNGSAALAAEVHEAQLLHRGGGHAQMLIAHVRGGALASKQVQRRDRLPLRQDHQLHAADGEHYDHQ